MNIIYLLIPIALVFVVLMAAVIVWAINSGQYDDLDRAATEILDDDDIAS